MVQAAVLADAGHHVICVYVDEALVENLKKGIIPVIFDVRNQYEPKRVEAKGITYYSIGRNM